MDRVKGIALRLLNPRALLPLFVLPVLCTALLWYPPLWQQADYPDRQSPFFEVVDERVSINTATLEELMLLPGVGEVKAAAILEYRRENGLFSGIDELLNVKGIGGATFDGLKEMICL